jgi:hypothetical protein
MMRDDTDDDIDTLTNNIMKISSELSRSFEKCGPRAVGYALATALAWWLSGWKGSPEQREELLNEHINLVHKMMEKGDKLFPRTIHYKQ